MKMRRWKLALFLCSTVGAVGCGVTGGHNLPPAERLAHPGPGVGGPGPGVLTPPTPPLGGVPGGFVTSSNRAAGSLASNATLSQSGGPIAQATVDPKVSPASYGGAPNCWDGASASGVAGSGVAQGMAPQDVQVLFGQPSSMQVHWDVTGSGQFDSTPLVTPGRQNFQQGGIYRLKLTSIPGAGREGVELYPTLEIGPPARRTLAYLAHNAIPIQLTEEDFDQVLAGNFVTKVIYLPDPEFQGLAVADVATLVSTRLEPGLDPIEEASRKGAILAVLRVGNKDMEIPGVDMTGEVMPASFHSASGCVSGDCGPAATANPCGCGAGHHGGLGCNGPNCQIGGYTPATTSMSPGGMPQGLVSGMGMPQYGMPMSGTPIGLPGPPHIPLGVPAGLQKHVIRNHTKMHIPDPVGKVKVNVKQRPGQSYPHPVSRVRITEDTVHPGVHFGHHFGTPSTGQVQQVCGPNCLGPGICPTCN